MTVYGYLRVSTDEQDYNNQKSGVEKLAQNKGLTVDEWIIDDGISGTKEPEKRALGKILKRIKKDDVILASELSRLGRKLFMIMRILEHCMNIGAKVLTSKDGYELGDNIQSKVLAFAFGIAAEIERDMISMRTKEALARKRSEGIILGRPFGSKSSLYKLDKQHDKIEKLYKEGKSYCAIARAVKAHRITVTNFIKNRGITR